MLVSHRKKFIFTKTAKTAGTSVESYFEKYCMPEGEWEESHACSEYVSEAGIIGFRGERNTFSPAWCKHKWYDHMSAKRIHALVGQDTWNKYFKFTVVRNPFDKLISSFSMWEKVKPHHGVPRRLRQFIKHNFLGKGGPIYSLEGETEVERFRSWILKGGATLDREKYFIGGEECVDYFIRFEDLDSGIEHVCQQLNIDFEPSRIPQFMSGIRKKRLEVKDYYDSETEAVVRRLFDWEINKFGYALPEQ